VVWVSQKANATIVIETGSIEITDVAVSGGTLRPVELEVIEERFAPTESERFVTDISRIHA
jgi:hypothetical protein